MSGKGRRAYNKAPKKEKLRKWGSLRSREGDKIKLVDVRFKLDLKMTKNCRIQGKQWVAMSSTVEKFRNKR